MIGEKILEASGHTTARRVLSTTGGQIAMEVSFEQTGKLLGVEVTDVATYEATMEPDGHLEGHCEGIGMTKEGEPVTWTAVGVGRRSGKSIQWRGSIQYRTSVPKLAKLNGNCFVFEYDVDDAGNSQGRVFEWK
jgi:hypothetical protein